MHEYALPTTAYRQQQQLQQLQQEYAHEYSQEYPARRATGNEYTPGDYGGDYAADYAAGDYANEYQTEYQQPHVNGPPPPLPSRRANQHQTRLTGTLTGSTPSSAIMAANPQLTPVVLPSFPASLRAGSGATYSPYSPSRFHIDKRCQHRCSWKCCSLALILLCVVLTSMLAYFGAVGSMRPGLDPSGCINVQDSKDLVRDEASLGLAPSQTAPTEESLPTSTAVQSASSRAPADSPDRPPDLPSLEQQQQLLHHQQQQQQQQQQQSPQQQPPAAPLSPLAAGPNGGGAALAGSPSGWLPAVVEMRELGVVHAATIPPNQFWNTEFRNKQPAFIRFNFTLPWGANFAVYGRRNVGPSVTQHDFVEFIKAGRLDHRARRSLDHVAAFVSSHSYYGDHEYMDDEDDDLDAVDLNAVSFMVPLGNDTKPPPPPPPPPMRRRRSPGVLAGLPVDSAAAAAGGVLGRAMRVNVSLLQYLDTGRWFLSVYNDDQRPQEVSLVVTEAEGVSTSCPNDCSGHGSCYLGKCDCIDGFEGIDCSKSVCPVLCSNHGKYGGGMCHCEGGWKGAECDVPARDCQVSDCSGRGRCVAGRCECQAGWKGEGCEMVDCEDPHCSGHGSCVEGRCYCKAGWQGPTCALLDQQVYQCLPGCSDHGTYDLESGACVCDAYWTGPDCSQPLCGLDCGPHGVCDEGRCKCRPGWTGERCDQLPCDQRCTEHGQCKNGTCVCSQGWNGRHCTLPGCINGCNRQGSCMLEDGEYRCVCSDGWAGRDCGIRLETECSDKKDNDNDGMMDCSDSECCQSAACESHLMCLSSKNPVEVLLRKQPPLVTASFYQRVKFLIEENSVQSYAHTDSYTERRVSVMRGQVVTPQGLGIYGVRVSVDKDARLGFTLTRAGGWFDMLVNGGGAVTLQFLRTPFQTTTRTVFVPWNQIVVLSPVVLPLAGDTARPRDRDAAAAAALGFEMPVSSLSLFSGAEDGPSPCEAHDHTLLKPVVVSTWMPEKVGGMPGRSLVFAETQILQEAIRIPGSDLYLQYQSSQAPGYLSTVLMRLTHDRVPATLTHVHVTVQIEGSVHTKTYEADPNLTHVFAWNKRNVYKQKVYGVAQAKVSVGYKHSTCRTIIWETQTATLQGFDVDISDIGGWGLHIHHHYNFHEGILQKGDGSTLHLKRYPRTIKVVVGTGLQRSLQCEDCNGVARDARLLTPVALASGPDGSLYVGDFNLIRRVTPDGNIYTVLQLSATQVSHQYYLSVSPADGHLYVSDTERHQILRVLQLGPNIEDPRINSEPAVGSGDRCVPGDENHCGDEGPALQARLAHPKGLVIAADKTMYIADGTNIRAVDPKGIIHTLVGHHGHHNLWQPIPCYGAIPAAQAQLQWPTGLALSPLDGSLHFIDDRLVLKLTSDRKVKVVAGMPLHCHASTCGAKDQPEPQDSQDSQAREREVPQQAKVGKQQQVAQKQAAGAGLGALDDKKKQEELENEEGSEATSTVLGSILSIAFSPNGELFIAEADSRKVNAIRVVDSAGRMSDFAGRPQPQDAFFPMHGCRCDDGRNATWGPGSTVGPGAGGPCSCGLGLPQDDPSVGSSAGKDSRETLLSSNAKFTSISAMVVSPDGVLHVADQGSLHVLALEHYLPTHDENGEFRIPFPPTGEVYVFNRYGQHVATRDLTSGNTRYTFLYSKNTSFGKLSTVTDAAGNKILFLRDYSNVVSTIENTQDHKSDLKISGIGFLEKFSEPGRSEIDLHYDSNTGLLTSRADAKGAGGKTSMYRFDELGRVTQVILATGETIELRSRISQDDGLAVEVLAPQAAIALATSTPPVQQQRQQQQRRAVSQAADKQGVTLRMAGRGARRLLISDGPRVSEAASYRNGSLTIRGPLAPWGGDLTCAARRRHPLLELALPVEAEMLPMWSDQVATASPSAPGPNTMAWSYNIVGDAGSSQHKLHQDLWVNHSRVLAMEYDQAVRRQTFYDREDQPLLTVTLDHEGLPLAWTPANGGASVNISYDRFRRVDSWRWGNQLEKYSYDRKGLLSEISNPEDGALQFTYDELNVPTVITLPSKRRFELRYDSDGGLRHITLPSGTHHSLSVQPSLGFLRATYTAPGAPRPYLQHFSYSGLLLQTVYPGDGARVIYKYTPAGKLAEVLHGDGRTRIVYSPVTGLASSVQHTERDLDYRWDLVYSGGVLVEERIEFGPKTGLNNAKISYEVDDNLRVVLVAGRVGGQTLPEHTLAYSPRTGAATQIGQFQVQRSNGNETRLADGTAVFTRLTNRMMQEVQVAVTIHNLEAFRMEFSYDSRGRISQTRTYTRNVGVNMYTNVKNFTWDADGQLIGVAAQEPWSFDYDPNGNMLSLTYRGNTIPMEYNQMDRVVKFGEGVYRYDSRGLVVQNAREERFHYNAKGLLVRTNKRGRFDVRYYYDHLDRLSVRKDNYGNVTQFFYTNHKRPNEVTQIYSPRDGKLMSLMYDDRGHLVFAQVYRHKYYIATDQCGTPVMVFNQYGEGIREIMRSPYGHIVYDSNPYLYLPIDFCGGLLDTVVSLVHMPGGKVYDPLIGQLMGPAWEDVPARLSRPTHLNLYRFNGNDPINVRRPEWRNHLTDHRSWLSALGYDVSSLAPQLYPSGQLLSPLSPFASPSATAVSPSRPSMAAGAQDGPPLGVVSGFLSHLSERLLSDRLSVSGWPSAAAPAHTRRTWPPNNPLQTFRIGSAFEPPFGRGIIVSRTAQGQAVINSVPSANPIYRDVFTSVFNGSYMLDVLLMVHGASQDTLFFVQPRVERAGEDRAQLKRLGGSVNTTFHEKTGDKEKIIDLKIHTQTAVINLRYGTTPEKEKQRILHHAKMSAVRKAWHREQEAIRSGLAGSGSGLGAAVEWSASEQDEILKSGQAAAYEGEFIHDIFRYPELAEDPYNVRFVKKNAGDDQGPGASAKRKRSAGPGSGSSALAPGGGSGDEGEGPPADSWWRPCTEPPC